MCDQVVSKEPFMSKYYLDRYKTEVMWNKAVDTFQPTSKFVSDWFVTNKILEKLDNFVMMTEFLLT